MRTLFVLTAVAGFFYAMHWFMAFQKDPYTYCKDHPTKELRDEYYLCQPGDFTFAKGVMEKTLPTPWWKPAPSEAEMKKRKKKAQKVEESDDELEQIDVNHYINND